MKVLSLTEPWATLIYMGKKKVETRSWKTNYRGELYIHASSTKIPKNCNYEVLELVEDVPLHYSHIICKCRLVDCIYMTEEFIEDMKNNHYIEYICGDYQVGRYAWILEDVEVLPEELPAKGHLGIWNYESDNRDT